MKKNTCYMILAAFISAANILPIQADTWSSLQNSKAEPTVKAVTPPPVQSSSATQLLFSEIEVLKLEIQSLQSKVEEQGFELQKIKKEQKERYLDLDRRMGQMLKPEALVPVVSLGGQGKSSYDAAFQLMKERRLDEAALAFKTFLQQFPKSTLVVNGYYWVGQIYYNQAKLDEARKAFTIVMNQFPDHAKTADSKYKLGVILHRLGDTVKAKKLLSSVVKQYKKSSTARFAKQYLKENFSNLQ